MNGLEIENDTQFEDNAIQNDNLDIINNDNISNVNATQKNVPVTQIHDFDIQIDDTCDIIVQNNVPITQYDVYNQISHAELQISVHKSVPITNNKDLDIGSDKLILDSSAHKSVPVTNNENDDDDDVDSEHVCSLCNTQFSNAYNLKRHTDNNVCCKDLDKRCLDLTILNNTVISLLQQKKVFSGLQKETLIQIKTMIDELVTLSTPLGDNKSVINNNSKVGVVNNNNGVINKTDVKGDMIANQNNFHININPLGCESVAHTTREDVFNIFSSSKPSVTIHRLFKCIYKNTENRNFTKDNIKEEHIKFIGSDLNVDYMSERLFKKHLIKRTLEYQLLLLNYHKELMSEEEMLKCMKIILRFQDSIQSNNISKEEYLDIIESLINKESRDKDILEKLNAFLELLKNDTTMYDEKVQFAISTLELQQNIIKEYEKAPEYMISPKKYKCINPTVETLQTIIQELHDDDRSLYSYKMKAKHYIEKKRDGY